MSIFSKIIKGIGKAAALPFHGSSPQQQNGGVLLMRPSAPIPGGLFGGGGSGGATFGPTSATTTSGFTNASGGPAHPGMMGIPSGVNPNVAAAMLASQPNRATIGVIHGMPGQPNTGSGGFGGFGPASANSPTAPMGFGPAQGMAGGAGGGFTNAFGGPAHPGMIGIPSGPNPNVLAAMVAGRRNIGAIQGRMPGTNPNAPVNLATLQGFEG